MKLPSMYGATILAGHAGISNPVESVTVLEYGQITSTLDELFSQTEFQGNALIISSFATTADDVDAQCENIRRYHAIGSVGFILFYIGLILPSVDDRVIACCNELDLVLITMPGDIRTHKYSDVIGDIYHAIFKDQQAGSNYVSTLIRRFSNLPAEQRNTSTLLRMPQQPLAGINYSNRLQKINQQYRVLAAIAIGAIKQGTKKNNCKKCRVNKRSRSLMMMVQIICNTAQHFWRAKKVSIYILLSTMNYYQEKICGRRVNLSSYIAIFGIKIWENL